MKLVCVRYTFMRPMLRPVFIVLVHSRSYGPSAGYTLGERTANVNIRYHSANVHAEANESRTFGSAGFFSRGGNIKDSWCGRACAVRYPIITFWIIVIII